MSEDIRYIGSTRAAEIMGLTSRRVVGLCNEGKLSGAVKNGRNWQIPEASVFEWIHEYGGVFVRENDMTGGYGLLPCAIGNTSFEEIAEDCYYVDKTLLIRDLVNDRNKVTLFMRPRRFGKTLALSMLKTYFEKTDEDTARYFRNKKIWKCGGRFRGMQGSYPVVMLTFKDIKNNSWADSMEALRSDIKAEFRRHAELYTSEKLSEDDMDYLRRLSENSLSDVEYSRALMVLTRMLSIHHGSRVIVLIDEYDTPIQQGYMNGFYQEVIAFMRNFLSSALKDNPHLEFGVLTGILRVSKENLFSGLNNLKVDSVLDDKYSEYFGFTGSEVQDMITYYGLKEKTEEVRRWYDGYRFGSSDIYNPWSVTNYVSNDGRARPYWVNTSDNAVLREMMQSLTPELAEELTKVMQGEEINVSLNTEIVYPRMSDGADDIFSFLLLAGYLTPAGEVDDTELGTFAALRLPNTEIKRVYNTEVLGWLKSRSTAGVIPELEKAIYLGDEKRLESALAAYMKECVSGFDGAGESFYHGMVLGLVASMSGSYYIRSNRESGDGRFDLQLEPKNGQFPGVIMEFKAAPAGKTDRLSELAEEALKQIESRGYDSELRSRGISNILKYGIAFSGKHAAVKIK